MDRRAWKEFITRRSTIWTASLCLTGALVLGGIVAVDGTRRSEEPQAEYDSEGTAYLEDYPEADDTIFEPLEEEEAPTEAAEQVSGQAREDEAAADGEAEEAEDGTPAAEDSETAAAEEAGEEGTGAEETDGEASVSGGTAEAASGGVISEQALLQEGIGFSGEESLLWPAAGTILIDYSMDGTVYFPTLNQYKYNPALIIGSEEGNQVLASAKGIVESVSLDEETGNTVVLNIGNDYRLTYGQLMELAVSEGDVVEAGALLGYVGSPTKYYSLEGSSLYFQMTRREEAVDPVLYLE